MMTDAIDSYFRSKGSTLRNILVGMAVLVTAITVILGGVKTLLAWAGYKIVLLK